MLLSIEHPVLKLARTQTATFYKRDVLSCRHTGLHHLPVHTHHTCLHASKGRSASRLWEPCPCDLPG